MSGHVGLVAVSRLVREARERQRMTQEALATATGTGRRTIAALEAAERVPLPATLRAVERALGLTAGVLDDVLASDNPGSFDLVTVTGGVRLAGVSDAELLWEMTSRLQARNAEVAQLRARIAELES